MHSWEAEWQSDWEHGPLAGRPGGIHRQPHPWYLDEDCLLRGACGGRMPSWPLGSTDPQSVSVEMMMIPNQVWGKKSKYAYTLERKPSVSINKRMGKLYIHPMTKVVKKA